MELKLGSARPCSLNFAMRSCALATAILVSGCSQLLGFGELAIDEDQDGPAQGSDGGIDGAIIASLWVYTTSASFGGDFGVAVNGRSAADAACASMYNDTYTHRVCTRIHAILQTDNSTDTLALMGERFSIPSSAPVLRAIDAAKVANRWDDVVNPNMQLIEAISPASPAALYVWTGRGMNADRQCDGWRSRSTSLFGDAGNAAKRTLWFVDGSFRCDNTTPRLACVCW